jgi:hypothetical protein
LNTFSQNQLITTFLNQVTMAEQPIPSPAAADAPTAAPALESTPSPPPQTELIAADNEAVSGDKIAHHHVIVD